MIKDKLNGILDKLEDNAELLGGGLGVLSYPMHYHGLSMETITFMIDRISKWKIPDIKQIFELMANQADSFPLASDIGGVIGGWAMGEFGSIIDPKVAKIGRVVKKGSLGALFGHLIGGFLWLPAAQNSGDTATNSAPMGGVYSI